MYLEILTTVSMYQFLSFFFSQLSGGLCEIQIFQWQKTNFGYKLGNLTKFMQKRGAVIWATFDVKNMQSRLVI